MLDFLLKTRLGVPREEPIGPTFWDIRTVLSSYHSSPRDSLIFAAFTAVPGLKTLDGDKLVLFSLKFYCLRRMLSIYYFVFS